MECKPEKSKPVFVWSDGKPFDVTSFRHVTWVSLARIGVDVSKHTEFSFRRGSSQAAADVGVRQDVICMLGDWNPNGNSHRRYNRRKGAQLAALRSELCKKSLAVGTGELDEFGVQKLWQNSLLSESTALGRSERTGIADNGKRNPVESSRSPPRLPYSKRSPSPPPRSVRDFNGAVPLAPRSPKKPRRKDVTAVTHPPRDEFT